MTPEKNKPASIDAYITAFPADIQQRLQAVRETIHAAAPEAEEAIAYQMPTFKLKGKNLVHFAAFKNHIGFYPAPSGIVAFEEALAPYKGAKGSVQFPLNQPLPLELISNIVAFRVQDQLNRAK